MSSLHPLAQFAVVNTCDLDETRAALGRAYAAPTLELVGRDRTFRAVVNRCQLQYICLNYGAYSSDLRMEFPETEFASQVFMIRGSGEARLGGVSAAIGLDCDVVVSPGEALTITNDSQGERLILRISSTALADKLSAITGICCSRPLKCNPIQNYAPRSAKALRDHFLFLVETLSGSAAPLPQRVLDEFEQTLMVMFLHANRHNYTHLLERTAPLAALEQISRTEEFIEANWQRAIRLEDLAKIAGVSALSLFRTFKNRRGYSPLAFLSQVRVRNRRRFQ